MRLAPPLVGCALRTITAPRKTGAHGAPYGYGRCERTHSRPEAAPTLS